MFGRISVIAAGAIFAASVGCGPTSAKNDAEDRIVGKWSGVYMNPAANNSRTGPNIDVEFEFFADGKFRMGKGKVWLEGTYQFVGSSMFEVKIKSMDAGPYEIVELTATQFIFERKLSDGRTQRTELTRKP